jgi:hypothetical protein
MVVKTVNKRLHRKLTQKGGARKAFSQIGALFSKKKKNNTQTSNLPSGSNTSNASALKRSDSTGSILGTPLPPIPNSMTENPLYESANTVKSQMPSSEPTYVEHAPGPEPAPAARAYENMYVDLSTNATARAAAAKSIEWQRQKSMESAIVPAIQVSEIYGNQDTVIVNAIEAEIKLLENQKDTLVSQLVEKEVKNTACLDSLRDYGFGMSNKVKQDEIKRCDTLTKEYETLKTQVQQHISILAEKQKLLEEMKTKLQNFNKNNQEKLKQQEGAVIATMEHLYKNMPSAPSAGLYGNVMSPGGLYGNVMSLNDNNGPLPEIPRSKRPPKPLPRPKPLPQPNPQP